MLNNRNNDVMRFDEKVFGNPDKVAIRYLPCPIEYNYDDPTKYAICHLVVNNIIIGDPTEECYLQTWFFQLRRNREFILNNKGNLFAEEFIGLSEREIFEIVVKSNQMEDDFDSNFLYLPQVSSTVWDRHLFKIDETTDGYLICYYVLGEEIRFIIEAVWPKRSEMLRSFTYAVVEVDIFLKILDDVIEYLELTYPYLKT